MPVLTSPQSPPRLCLPAAFSALEFKDDPTLRGYLYHNELGFNCVHEGRLVNEMTVVHTIQRHVTSVVINTYAAGLSDISTFYTHNHYEVVDRPCAGSYRVMVNTLRCRDSPISSDGVADKASYVEIQTVVTGYDSYGFRFEEILDA